MDPGSVIPVPDQVRDDRSGNGLTGTEESRIRPAPFRHSGLDPESMFIGTRRRKNFRSFGTTREKRLTGARLSA
jgi:hypothetical protein